MSRSRIQQAIIFVICGVFLALSVSGAQAGVSPEWTGPTLFWDQNLNQPSFYSISDDGTCMVALLPSGGTDQNRSVAVRHKVGGVWQSSQVIATNGLYSDDPFQFLPATTKPVISGDGQTIVYLGWYAAGATNGAFMVKRLGETTWSAPVYITPTLANVHEQISISRNGKILALSDYPFMGTQHVYILYRTGDSWSEPERITPLDPGQYSGGGMPSLSADGLKLTYIQNARVMFSEWTETGWTYPAQLTDNDPWVYNVEYPQLSKDGCTIYYWLVRLVEDGGMMVRKDQDLYRMRRSYLGWGNPEKITATPVIPSFVTEGPPAVNAEMTRYIYPRPVRTGDSINSSRLEMVEYSNNAWQITTLVEPYYMYDMISWPCMPPDSSLLVFKSSERYGNMTYAYGALWQLTNTPDPAPAVSQVVVSNAGGTLYSPPDETTYTFLEATFTENVLVSHNPWIGRHAPPPMMPPGPPNMAGIGHEFELTAYNTNSGLPAQPLKNVPVEIDYGGPQGLVTLPGTLKLYRVDGSEFVEVPSVDDPVEGVLTASLDHFSWYAVMGETYQNFLPLTMH